MDGWRLQRAAAGMYDVRPAAGYGRIGFVVGGRRRWAAERCGETIGHYPTARAAAAAVYAAHSAALRRSVPGVFRDMRALAGGRA